MNVIVSGIPLLTIGTSVAIQADQKILVAGYVVLSSGATPFFVARYNTNGTLDTTFQDGSAQPGVIVDASSDSTSGPFLIIQPDQKILVGIANLDGVSNQNYPQIIRYNHDATVDLSFNGSGRTSAFFDGTNSITNSLIGLQSDGKIVSAGGVSPISFNPFGFAVVRFTILAYSIQRLVRQMATY